jgi:hypothetical protein
MDALQTHDRFRRTYARFRDPSEMQGTYTVYGDVATFLGGGCVAALDLLQSNRRRFRACQHTAGLKHLVAGLVHVKEKHRQEVWSRKVDKRNVDRWLSVEQERIAKWRQLYRNTCSNDPLPPGDDNNNININNRIGRAIGSRSSSRSASSRRSSFDHQEQEEEYPL